MPPKANNNRPSRRGSRSSTHTGGSTPAGSNSRQPSIGRRAAEEADSRNRGERVIDAIMNVRQTNPVGLSAAHASAVYGKNTYSVDSGRSSDSKAFKAVDEAAEDEAFEAQIFGTNNKKKTAMGRSGSSSLRKAMSDAVADMTTNKTKEDVDHTDLNPVDTTDAAFDRSSSAAAEHEDFDDTWHQTNDVEPERGPRGNVRPPMDPSRPPHLSGNRNNHLGQAADRNSSNTAYNGSGNTYNGLRPPSEPPSSLRSKYGIPTGRASSEPYSPGRPGTSRSFTQESDLYGDASIHTPAPIPGPKRPIRPSPLGKSSVAAGNSGPTGGSSPAPPVKQPTAQAGPPKPFPSGSQKRPGPLEQEKTRKPIVGPHTPHIPHLLDEKLAPPPSLNHPVAPVDGGSFKENADPYKEPEEASSLRDRMRYKKPPKIIGPKAFGVPPVQTQDITQEEHNEVAELRRRFQNPNLASSTLGKAARPLPQDPLPTSQKPVASTTTSQTTGIHSPKKTAPQSAEAQKEVPNQENTEQGSIRVHKGTLTPGEKSNTSTGDSTSVPPSRSWFQLPQKILWPIPLDVVKDFIKLLLIFAVSLITIMSCIHFGSRASDHVGHYTAGFWPGVKDTFRGFIPNFPQTVRHPLQDYDGQDLFDRLGRIEHRLGALEDTIQGNSTSEPNVVDEKGKVHVPEFPSESYLEVDKQGKAHVPEEFWHAVRDRIQAETGTVVKLRGDEEGLPPYFWSAFKRILNSEKSGSSGASYNADDVENLVNKKLLNGWESWVRQNSETVAKILANAGGGKMAVSKEQFAQQVQKELEAHKKNTRTSCSPSVSVTRRSHKNWPVFRKAPPQGMSRLEIKNLVDQWTNKAVTDAKFEAMAQTGIKAHLDDYLRNKVNFFGSIGSGAVIDPTYTSPMWRIPRPSFKTKAWHKRDGYKPQSAIVALQHWTDEGQCFCSAGDRNTISVLLSRDISPQHLVVEHILPGATLHPDAMPREIEVWAYLEELNLRTTISSWSSAQFPDTPEEKTLDQGFVKIGHFVFRQQTEGTERQLFKLSSELANMGAITHHVVIRAVSNYGADHTCFYRVQLFGDKQQEDMDKGAQRA
ncbi:uncharacterized protein PG998_004059 [Apiospora kogelbergensis]|uniref:uncharacterized protein n=1 Tax=Apiospora kogelbergensis TaxID=1337665 RepID=UPI0031314F86